MKWVWDNHKNTLNTRKHGIRFDTAQLVFSDPLALSRPDATQDRWQTVGSIGPIVLFVIHTWPEQNEDTEIGRIISARKATRHERKAYEEGQFQ